MKIVTIPEPVVICDLDGEPLRDPQTGRKLLGEDKKPVTRTLRDLLIDMADRSEFLEGLTGFEKLEYYRAAGRRLRDLPTKPGTRAEVEDEDHRRINKVLQTFDFNGPVGSCLLPLMYAWRDAKPKSASDAESGAA